MSKPVLGIGVGKKKASVFSTKPSQIRRRDFGKSRNSFLRKIPNGRRFLWKRRDVIADYFLERGRESCEPSQNPPRG
jgi:hypothetical protein